MEKVDVGDNFEMLVTDFLDSKKSIIQQKKSSTVLIQDNDSATIKDFLLSPSLQPVFLYLICNNESLLMTHYIFYQHNLWSITYMTKLYDRNVPIGFCHEKP